MHHDDFIQIGVYITVLLLLIKPLGAYMANVYEGRPAGLNIWFVGIEKWIYRVCGIKYEQGMTWKEYAVCLMVFNVLGILMIYALQRLQSFLPLNPMGMASVSPDSSFNTAVSFVTNTNWQGYSGENTMSYLTQILALAKQNFLSAATGMVVLVALIRGFVQKEINTIGNFWVDIVRTILYILLPLSFVFALVLVSQGVPQTFSPYLKTANGQQIALGPVASQVAVKQLGTNGGGYYNANSAHPFENPNAFTNFLEMLAILLIPAALCYTFGCMVRDQRQGWALLAVMLIILIPCLFAVTSIEHKGNPLLDHLAINQAATPFQSGGNMEGKEARFGIVSSTIWSVATTAASNGSVNAMHDSYLPLSGMVLLWLIQLGEVIFGGAGSGLYGMIGFVIIAVFIAGLMIGRTPEYLGKKIEAFEMKMASLMAVIPHFFILISTAVAVLTVAGRAGMANPGPHGFTEILYAFSSASGNNGSAFAGINANTFFYNTLLGLCMFCCRFWLIIPILAIAGSLSAKKAIPVTQGTLPTYTPLFVFFLAMVILIVGALAFFPALALGPIAEHLMLK